MVNHLQKFVLFVKFVVKNLHFLSSLRFDIFSLSHSDCLFLSDSAPGVIEIFPPDFHFIRIFHPLACVNLIQWTMLCYN